MESGFTEKQAEAQTKIIGNLLSLASKTRVNKQDILLLEERLKRELTETESRLESKIVQVESKILETESRLELKFVQIESKMMQVESKIIQVESRIIKMLFTAFGATTGLLASLIAYLH